MAGGFQTPCSRREKCLGTLECFLVHCALCSCHNNRESNATYTPSGMGNAQPVHIGFPMKEAVWRTNHGYDPVIRQHYLWSQSPSADSIRRYMYIHDAFTDYQNAGTKIGTFWAMMTWCNIIQVIHTNSVGTMEALNITAIVGDKGQSHPYTCMDNSDGTNVLSVTFHPQQQILVSSILYHGRHGFI